MRLKLTESGSPLSMEVYISGLLLTALALAPVFISDYWSHLLTLAGVGSILALGLNIFYGYCGQINFGVAAFYGIGGYISAILGTKFGLPFPLALIGALAGSSLIAVIVGFPLLRLREHSLALGTFAFTILFYALVNEFDKLTGGFDGFILRPTVLMGVKLGYIFWYYFTLISSLIAYLLSNYLYHSRVGRAMTCIRSDESLAMSVGISINRYKLLGFLLNCLFSAFAGVILVHSKQFVAPQDYTIWTSVLVVLMVVIGGVGSNLGAVLGGILFMILPEFLIYFKTYQVMVNGLVLIVVLIFFPKGLGGLIDRRVGICQS